MQNIKVKIQELIWKLSILYIFFSFLIFPLLGIFQFLYLDKHNCQFMFYHKCEYFSLW